MKTQRSEQLFEQALRWIPGGVNSPVRAFQSVEGKPLFLARGKGSRVWDVDGNEFIDLVGSWGPLILGHANPVVLDALEATMKEGTSFGAPTEKEIELARWICEAFPSIQKVRLTNSGTEAAATAVRLARGYKKREKIVKFAGCYHGHVDSLLVEAGSGALTGGKPTSAGILESNAQATMVLDYNDTESVKKLLEKQGEQIAAVILEPFAANMGVVPPSKEFLKELRAACDRSGTLLIFDEVISGFRLAYGGAQEKYGIQADLTILGKIIGGGLPVGAIGGRSEIMDHLAPLGSVYHAGTLSGNPLAVAAGIAMLKELKSPSVYKKLDSLGQRLSEGLKKIGADMPIPLTVQGEGSLVSIFFSKTPVKNLKEVQQTRKELYTPFFWKMLERGIYLPPSPFEAFFLSTAHAEKEIDQVVNATKESLREIQ